MKPVKTRSDAEEAAMKAVEALYGPGFQDFKIREMLPYISDQLIVKGGLPTEDRKGFVGCSGNVYPSRNTVYG